MYADICGMLNIQYPIIQGAMAWISDPSLVSAVSEAGGLGVLATGHLDAEGCVKAIKEIRAVSYTHLDVYKRQPVVTTGTFCSHTA